jgi:hypothetical protein
MLMTEHDEALHQWREARIAAASAHTAYATAPETEVATAWAAYLAAAEAEYRAEDRLHGKRCVVCGDWLDARSRSDRRTCSARCRVALSRRLGQQPGGRNGRKGA